MPQADEGLEAQGGTPAILIVAALFVGAVLMAYRTGQNTVLQQHILATVLLALPAYILAHGDSKYLVPYLVFVWAVAPEVRRVVDWMQGGFHPQSYIAVAPMLATASLAIPVFRQRIVVPALLYKALASLALALGYAGVVGYIRNQTPAVFEFGATVTPLLVLLYASGRTLEPRERDLWVLSVVYVAIGVATYGIIQYIYAPAWDVMWMRAVQREFIAIGRPEPYGIRVFSTFGSPLQCSLFLLTALVPMLVEPKWRRMVGFVGAAVIAYTLLLTITRTAWVAMLAGVAAYILVSRMARRVQLIAGMFVFGAVIWFALPYLPGYETVSERVTGFRTIRADTSMVARTSILQTLWDVILSNPVGSGMGTYGVATRLAVDPGRRNTGFDNGYIGLADSYGWFGLLMFLRGLWLLIRSVREYRLDPERERFVRLSLAMIVAYAVYTGSAYGAGVFVLLLGISLPFGTPKAPEQVEQEPLFVDAARPLRPRIRSPQAARTGRVQ
ncbi:MAG: O-antigen ligase family protein [Armatimonadetes bacterium]|nr:O-antigen ligase family protein [Armatimonadota bacterium]